MVGHARGDNRYLTVHVPARHLRQFRVRLAYSPHVIRQVWYADHHTWSSYCDRHPHAPEGGPDRVFRGDTEECRRTLERTVDMLWAHLGKVRAHFEGGPHDGTAWVLAEGEVTATLSVPGPDATAVVYRLAAYDGTRAQYVPYEKCRAEPRRRPGRRPDDSGHLIDVVMLPRSKWSMRVDRGPFMPDPPTTQLTGAFILGLLLGTRHLALYGATPEQLRPARRLLIFASLATLALNIADPLITGAYGKAAFDTVGPLLLIGWAEVGARLLQAIAAISGKPGKAIGVATYRGGVDADEATTAATGSTLQNGHSRTPEDAADRSVPAADNSDLLDRARQEDSRHWADYQRPISAETLRKNLRIGAARSRMLVAMVDQSASG